MEELVIKCFTSGIHLLFDSARFAIWMIIRIIDPLGPDMRLILFCAVTMIAFVLVFNPEARLNISWVAFLKTFLVLGSTFVELVANIIELIRLIVATLQSLLFMNVQLDTIQPRSTIIIRAPTVNLPKYDPTKDDILAESNKDACKCCLTNVMQCAYVPCGHLAICLSCLHGMASQNNGSIDCIICRTPSERVLRIFH